MLFFRSFVASKVRKGRSEKRGGAKDRLFKMSTKFAPRLRARAIWTSKSLKTSMPGALLEVEFDKICTTPARESDFKKSKSLKTGMPGALLEVGFDKICTTPARKSDFYEKKTPRCMFGPLLEVKLRKICTTPARENDLEVKIVKN